MDAWTFVRFAALLIALQLATSFVLCGFMDYL